MYIYICIFERCVCVCVCVYLYMYTLHGLERNNAGTFSDFYLTLHTFGADYSSGSNSSPLKAWGLVFMTTGFRGQSKVKLKRADLQDAGI